jgi:hypothetical protein
MISLNLARKLKKAGLVWTPVLNDFFAIPDRDLDEKIFVLSDMAIFIQLLRGHPSLVFHGTPEWALDYILVSEVVWLPSESQLREKLEILLIDEPQPTLIFTSGHDGYACRIHFQGERLSFEAFGANDAYGLALLHVLEHQ